MAEEKKRDWYAKKGGGKDGGKDAKPMTMPEKHGMERQETHKRHAKARDDMHKQQQDEMEAMAKRHADEMMADNAETAAQPGGVTTPGGGPQGAGAGAPTAPAAPPAAA